MLYELENPQKVKPYFDKDASLIERDPILAYKIGFFFMLGVNIILALILMS
jgi:hypothetical protein